MSVAELPRVRFRERQPLTAADLNAEQAHRLALRRRHNAGQHGWGIVTGLDLLWDARGLIVESGMAIDGYGRELVLPEPVLIEHAALIKVGPDIEAWLLYGREAAGRDCWREACRLRLTSGSAPALPAFDPSRTPPDDPEAEWPVPLGLTTPGTEFGSGRVYAALTGEEVRDPAGRVRLAFSRVEGRERLAVGIRGAGEETVERLAVERLPTPPPLRARPGECPPPVPGPPAPAWKATVRANARVGGIRLEAPAAGGPQGVRFGTALPAPKAPAPWSIYRAAADPEGTHPEELRFEIGHPGDKGEPAAHRFVLPCLSATADRTVTVYGDLIVNGLLVQGPVPADPDNPAFASAVAGAWIKGIKAALSQDISFQASLSVTGPATLNQPLPYTLKIQNSGHVELSTFSFNEKIMIGAETKSRSYTENVTLPAGQSHTFSGYSQGFFQTGKAILSLAVQARGPGGNVVQQETRVPVTVNPSGPLTPA